MLCQRNLKETPVAGRKKNKRFLKTTMKKVSYLASWQPGEPRSTLFVLVSFRKMLKFAIRIALVYRFAD